MIEFKYAGGIVNEEEYQKKIDEARTYVARAEQDNFGGWVNLPINYDKDEFARIQALYGDTANRIMSHEDYDEITSDPLIRYVPCRIDKIAESDKAAFAGGREYEV